jgi:osmotically-inducible protein OsmY
MDVRALVNHGVTSLFGTVPSENDIALACRTAGRVKGVVKVISRLEVRDIAGA